MTDKTWTAVDISAGKVQLWVDDGSNLHIERPYCFVDASGEEVPVGSRKMSVTAPWNDVPQDIKDALSTINTWTRNRILSDEGMD